MGRHVVDEFVTAIAGWLPRRGTAVTQGSAADTAMLGAIAALPAQAALDQLGSTLDGLTTREAANRLVSIGNNEVMHTSGPTIPGELASRLFNPLNALLLALAAASYGLGDRRAAVIIGIMVVLSITLGFVQEHRSNKAAQALRRMVQNKATVIRQNAAGSHAPCDIPISDVVPGDVVVLSAGDMVPADLRLIAAKASLVKSQRAPQFLRWLLNLSDSLQQRVSSVVAT